MGLFKEVKGLVGINSNREIEQIKGIAESKGVIIYNTISDDTTTVDADFNLCEELLNLDILSQDEFNDISNVDILMFYIK